MGNTSKVAYVTGGMGGIGTAISQRLCTSGFKVVAGCGSGSPRCAQGYEVYASEGNVSNWDSTKAAFDAVRAEHGPVDVLINNAGITRDCVFRKLTNEQWHEVIETNLNSLFHVTKQVIDGMLEKGWGRIINMRPEAMERFVATTPVRRLGTPEEIASIVACIASDESGFATGADFRCMAACT